MEKITDETMVTLEEAIQRGRIDVLLPLKDGRFPSPISAVDLLEKENKDALPKV